MCGRVFCIIMLACYSHKLLLSFLLSLLSPCYAEYLISDNGGQQLSISDAFIKGNFVKSYTWDGVSFVHGDILGASHIDRCRLGTDNVFDYFSIMGTQVLICVVTLRVLRTKNVNLDLV